MEAGDRFGRLVVQSFKYKVFGDKTPKTYPVAEVKCDCGKVKDVLVKNLTRNIKPTRSCGCLTAEAAKRRLTTHGRSKVGDGTYVCWQDMLRRCLTPTHKSFKDYGARGIKVCERWSKFENFLADMGEQPKGLQIERKENNGDYEPGNCKWATRHEQTRNHRRNVNITITMCMTDWAAIAGIAPVTIWKRINQQNMTPEAAVMQSLKEKLPTVVG